jgi:S1-C subfamily serine protease
MAPAYSLPIRVIRKPARPETIAVMALNSLSDFSNQIADAIAAAGQSVVQVHGRRQPASGVVHSTDVIVTTTRAIGAEDGLTVRTPDGREVQAEFAGWDPATNLVTLRAPGLNIQPIAVAPQPRVGHVALAIARSWSNSLTATTGIVSVIGGPLPTGRGRAIEEVIRTSAPMHRGFAGGALVNAEGQLMGITTAAEIRGLGVVIPAAIAWRAVDSLLKNGRARRRYLGVAGQSVQLPSSQRPADGQSTGVLVLQVVDNSPAAQAGVLVGDVLVSLDGRPIEKTDALLEALAAGSADTVAVGVLRGGQAQVLQVAMA